MVDERSGISISRGSGWRTHVTAAAVVVRDERFLLVEERCGGRLVINQPAGHLEEGESPVEAVIRETHEETGWHIEAVSLLAIQQWHRPARHDSYLRFLYEARAISHDAVARLDSVIADVLWLDEAGLHEVSDRLRSPLVLDAIAAYRSGRRHPLDCVRTP